MRCIPPIPRRMGYIYPIHELTYTPTVMRKLPLPNHYNITDLIIWCILHFIIPCGKYRVTFHQGWRLFLCYSMVRFLLFSIASYEMFACSWQPYPLILYLKGFVGRTEHLDKLLKDLIFGTWFKCPLSKISLKVRMWFFLLAGMASCMFLSERQIYHTF